MDFFKAQLTKIPRVAPVDLSNKTVLITGANSGLGLETAREVLLSRPERMILAVRSIERGEAAVADLTRSKPATTNIELQKLDQSSFESVQTFVKGLSGRPIDIAILNAGVSNPNFTQTADNLETNLQVNFLSPALLSLLLLPNLRAASSSSHPAHLVFVSSGLHAQAKFPEHNAPTGSILTSLNDPVKYNQSDRYATTKLLNLLWVKELARRVPYDQVVINAPNPGFCKTGLMDKSGGVMGAVTKAMMALVGRDPQDGARCIVNAALHGGHETHGRYLSEMEVKEDVEMVKQLGKNRTEGRIWSEILALLKERRQSNLPLDSLLTVRRF